LTATKYQVGDRVRINAELFPSADKGLFNALKGTGTVMQVDPESILPYRCRMDGFEHHPFWFYENQLLFEDAQKEQAYQAANAAKPRVHAPAKPAPPAAKVEGAQG